MIIQESDLFKGLSPEIINEIANIMTEESYHKGDFIFTAESPAEHFYILEEGQIRLNVGEEGRITHVVNHPGEAFGWSSLVDHETYTASAECMAPTKVIRIERKKLNAAFEKDPTSGMIFFRRLAEIVGQRLIHSYFTVLSAYKSEGPPSYG
jgi:CRP-like cAMP-binding protein